MSKLGKKTKLKIIKTKGGHRVLNTNSTAGKVQQSEEAGHPPVNPPIKIKLKRLTSSMHKSQTVSQSESSGNTPLHPAPSQPARHDLTDVYPHPTPGGHTVGGQVREAMLVDQPFLPGPGTLLPNENCWETWTHAIGSPLVNAT